MADAAPEVLPVAAAAPAAAGGEDAAPAKKRAARSKVASLPSEAPDGALSELPAGATPVLAFNSDLELNDSHRFADTSTPVEVTLSKAPSSTVKDGCGFKTTEWLGVCLMAGGSVVKAEAWESTTLCVYLETYHHAPTGDALSSRRLVAKKQSRKPYTVEISYTPLRVPKDTAVRFEALEPLTLSYVVRCAAWESAESARVAKGEEPLLPQEKKQKPEAGTAAGAGTPGKPKSKPKVKKLAKPAPPATNRDGEGAVAGVPPDSGDDDAVPEVQTEEEIREAVIAEAWRGLQSKPPPNFDFGVDQHGRWDFRDGKWVVVVRENPPVSKAKAAKLAAAAATAAAVASPSKRVKVEANGGPKPVKAPKAASPAGSPKLKLLSLPAKPQVTSPLAAPKAASPLTTAKVPTLSKASPAPAGVPAPAPPSPAVAPPTPPAPAPLAPAAAPPAVAPAVIAAAPPPAPAAAPPAQPPAAPPQ